jgi:1-aminocyclopropane-1-carboxylate deaminase/D-cysteine desulfhydrase-like pyridoxal-dependent ACC family enzyme
LDVHLVLGGPVPEWPAGNQLLSALFGACVHHPGTDDWGELEKAKDALADELRACGRRPFAIPIGGSTAIGAVGFTAAFVELVEQAAGAGCRPRAVVHATSSGGTHAGLLAGRAVVSAGGASVPDVIAFAVAKGVLLDDRLAAELAGETLALLGLDDVGVDPADVHVEGSALGAEYAAPTAEADDALLWAARHGGWVLDRVYTAKAFAGLLSMAGAGRWGPGDDVVFWHTGGQPAVFAPGGAPSLP